MENKKNKSDFEILLPEKTENANFQSRKVNKGWLVWATDRNGTVTAMTFVPE